MLFNTIILLLLVKFTLQQETDAGAKASFAASQQAAMAAALAQAAPYAAMGIPVNIKVPTPPPPPEIFSIAPPPSLPSEYDDLFTYVGYFDPYPDDVQAFAKNGRRRKRHRINCGRDRKGRHCDYRRSHHQHGFYNKDCIHYAGSLEIYGVWQCGSRQTLRDGSIVRLMVELHELILKYKQDKNNYAMERFNRIVEYNQDVYMKLKNTFYDNAETNFQKVIAALDAANQQIFENFLSLYEMSRELIQSILKDREGEIEEIKTQLQQLLEDYPAPLSICDNLDDCGTCSARQGCIWCTEEQHCSEGTRSSGAFYVSCDLWAQGVCQDYHGPTKPVIRYDFTQQEDLDLSQKLYIASKQREMIQLKNQIESRREILSKISSMATQVRNKNIKLIDQYMLANKYDGKFLDQIDPEDAEGGMPKWVEEVDEMQAEYEQDKADDENAIKEKQEKKNNKQKEKEAFMKEQFEKRNKAIPINKKPYNEKEQIEYVLQMENQKYQPGE